MAKFAKSHRDLDAFQTALEAALAMSRIAAAIPRDELPLKDQMRRSGRAPGAFIPEAWRKRKYPRFWINKLSDAQAEAGEAQYWLEIAWREGYCAEAAFLHTFDLYEKLIAQLTNMIADPRAWCGNSSRR